MPRLRAGDGQIEPVRHAAQIEIVVDDEVTAFRGHARARQFDDDPRVEQLAVTLEAPVAMQIHRRQQPARRRQAPAPDLQHIVIRTEPVASQRVHHPCPLAGPVAAGRAAMPREIQIVAGAPGKTDTSRPWPRRVRPARPAGLKAGASRQGEYPPIVRQSAIDGALVLQLPAIEHRDTAADRLHGRGRVRDEQDRPPVGEEALQRSHALLLKILVANGEDLIEEQDVRLELRGDGEAEPHVHPGRIALDRDVHELP